MNSLSLWWITHASWFSFLTLIRWIIIYPLDSAIQRLNNWNQTCPAQAFYDSKGTGDWFELETKASKACKDMQKVIPSIVCTSWNLLPKSFASTTGALVKNNTNPRFEKTGLKNPSITFSANQNDRLAFPYKGAWRQLRSLWVPVLLASVLALCLIQLDFININFITYHSIYWSQWNWSLSSRFDFLDMGCLDL